MNIYWILTFDNKKAGKWNSFWTRGQLLSAPPPPGWPSAGGGPCDEMTASSCLDLAWPCWPLPGPGSIAQPRARINSRHHRSPASQPRVLQQTTPPPPPPQPPGDGALVKDAWCTCSHRVSFILATSSLSPEPSSSSSMVCTTVYLKGVATVSALFYVYSLGLTAHFDLNKITGSK